MAYLGKALFLADLGSQLNGLKTDTRSAKERLPRLYPARSPTQHVGPWCPDEYGVFLSPRAQTTRQTENRFAYCYVVWAKLAIHSDRLESLVINREICIPNREIGRFSIFYQKSGDLPKNRETWKLCNLVAAISETKRCRAFNFDSI